MQNNNHGKKRSSKQRPKNRKLQQNSASRKNKSKSDKSADKRQIREKSDSFDNEVKRLKTRKTHP